MVVCRAACGARAKEGSGCHPSMQRTAGLPLAPLLAWLGGCHVRAGCPLLRNSRRMSPQPTSATSGPTRHTRRSGTAVRQRRGAPAPPPPVNPPAQRLAAAPRVQLAAPAFPPCCQRVSTLPACCVLRCPAAAATAACCLQVLQRIHALTRCLSCFRPCPAMPRRRVLPAGPGGAVRRL